MLVSTSTICLIYSASTSNFRVVIGDSFLIVIVEESGSSIMSDKTSSRHHVWLYQTQVALHIWWSDRSIFRVQGYWDASSIRPWCDMDFASILTCFNIWVILAKVLKSLAEISPHLRAIDRYASLLKRFEGLCRRIRIPYRLVCRLLVISRELIFFLKKVVRTNGSLTLLWRRSAFILDILNICPPLMIWRALLARHVDQIVFLSDYLAPSPLVICLCSVIIVIILISFVFLIYAVAIFDIGSVLVVQHYILILGQWAETTVTIDLMPFFLRWYLAP